MSNNGKTSRLSFSLEDIKKSLTHGSIDRAVLNNLRGFNHGVSHTYLPQARNLQGKCYWVRPQLNLTTGNIDTNRVLSPLLGDNTLTIPAYIRHMLDPRTSVEYRIKGSATKPATPSKFIDTKQAFIPIMTNSLRTCTGWPDVTVKAWSDKEGIYKQRYTMVDGTSHNRQQVEINASFRNSDGEPILNMFYIWCNYMGLVYEGKVSPYPDFIAQNEIDYQTRIFRILYDKTGQYVAKIGATGPAIPMAVGVGGGYDFNEAVTYNEANETIDIRFKCHGVEYQDPILMYEFDVIAEMFNPALAERHGTMTMIPYPIRKYFNHVGYPYIDLGNAEFQVWVDNDVAEGILSRYRRTGLSEELNQFFKSGQSLSEYFHVGR